MKRINGSILAIALALVAFPAFAATPDGLITTKAKAKLAAADDVKATAVHIDTNDGVVTLHGRVATAAQKARAEKLVREVGDVREVKNLLMVGAAPAGTPGATAPATAKRDGENELDDARIVASVKLRLLTTADVPAMDINVDAEDKVVYLFGMVPTEATKKAAGTEAAKVDGVTRVENELQVVASNKKETAEANDNDIARDVRIAFKARPEFKDVKTVVEGGTVRLSGKVGSDWEQLSALRLARGVPGVKNVMNQLEIDPDKAKKPAQPDRRY